MGIAKIWDIIWDNEPFHWATAFVLIVAVIVEFFTVWHYWHSECGETNTAIRFLNKLNKGKKNATLSNKNRLWLKEHLGTDEPSRFRKYDKTFILIKYPTVLIRPIPRSSLRFVTTLCTAIGVLGTFYGIQEGLQGINLDTTSSQQLMASSKYLLVGMKTAFSTSLMGLGSGSLFTLVLFITDTLKQKQRDSLRHRLKAIATLKTADNTNLEVAEALSLVTKNLTGLKQLNAESIGQAVGRSIAEQNINREVAEALSLVAKTLTGLKQLNAESIGQAVGTSIAEQFVGLNQLSAQSIGLAVRQQIFPALEAIFKEQKQLRELQENQGQRVLEELIKDLRVQVLEPIVDRLDKSAELTQQASKAVLTLHTELGGISQSLASSILTIQNFQKETLLELKVFANHLGYTLNQFQTDTKGVLQQTALEINRAVDQSITGMTAQRSAFETSAEQAAATFRGIREELQKALQESAEIERQMHHGFANNLGVTLNQFQTDTKSVLQQTALEINRSVDQSIQGMTAQRSAFETSAEQAAVTFRGIREELQIALQERARVEQEMLQATRTGIIQILTQANRAFQEQTNTLETVGNQASILMNDAKTNLLETLGNIDTTLTYTRETVKNDLTKFREEYQANLHAFFKEQNDLLEGTLGEQRVGLARVVTNLDCVFQEEAQRRIQLTQEVDRSMTQIRQAAREVGELVAAVGLNSSQRLLQLEDLARGIGEQVQIVDNSYKNLNDKFDYSLQSWRIHLEDSMQKTVGLQESFFHKADEAMTQVCGRVLNTASVLLDANDKRNSANGRNHHG